MPMRPPVHTPVDALGLTRKQARNRERETASARGYDRAWQKVRLIALKRSPLCADCRSNGVLTPAVDVHHIARICDRPDLRLDLSNLMCLCVACHSKRTSRGE